MRVDEGLVELASLDQELRDAVQEGEVAARVDEEEAVGELGPEERRVGRRGDPVALEPGLLVGVHDDDPCPLLLRLVDVLRRDGLVVREVRAEEDEEVALDPVDVADRRRRDADGGLETRGRGGVAEARRVLDVGRAEEAGDLLCDVIHLVGDATRGEVEGEPVGVARAHALGELREGLVPAHAREAGLALSPAERVGEAAELAELVARAAGEGLSVGERVRVERRHGVQAQELEADEAEVRPLDRPVLEPARPERAAVADAVPEEPEGVGEPVAVLPDDPQHGQVVVRLHGAEPERGPFDRGHGRELRAGAGRGQAWRG